MREDHGRRDGVEVLAHRFSRAARVGGVAQALEVGPLLGGTRLLVDVARPPCRFVLSHEARASILSLSRTIGHFLVHNRCDHFLCTYSLRPLLVGTDTLYSLLGVKACEAPERVYQLMNFNCNLTCG
jgi:hypothetical protein